VVGQGSIALYPELERSRYAAYKEAWHLLKRPEGIEIQACADPEYLEEFAGEEVAGLVV
jgi:hypothetical protein